MDKLPLELFILVGTAIVLIAIGAWLRHRPKPWERLVDDSPKKPSGQMDNVHQLDPNKRISEGQFFKVDDPPAKRSANPRPEAPTVASIKAGNPAEAKSLPAVVISPEVRPALMPPSGQWGLTPEQLAPREKLTVPHIPSEDERPTVGDFKVPTWADQMDRSLPDVPASTLRDIHVPDTTIPDMGPSGMEPPPVDSGPDILVLPVQEPIDVSETTKPPRAKQKEAKPEYKEAGTSRLREWDK